jgi:hypothetical protein
MDACVIRLLHRRHLRLNHCGAQVCIWIARSAGKLQANPNCPDLVYLEWRFPADRLALIPSNTRSLTFLMFAQDGSFVVEESAFCRGTKRPEAELAWRCPQS